MLEYSFKVETSEIGWVGSAGFHYWLGTPRINYTLWASLHSLRSNSKREPFSYMQKCSFQSVH